MKTKLVSLMLSIVMVFTLCPSAFAADTATAKEGRIVFTGLDQLGPNESIVYTITEPDGSEAVIGIEKLPGSARASGQSHRVWYSGLGSSVEFYMDVSNNKVTAVYDYDISLFGRTYEDPSLTKTSTYGKLTFTLKSITGAISGTCWLKGTVTGSDNEITVDWKM